jgi:predicted DNA-binding transcriptional regulator AlpA
MDPSALARSDCIIDDDDHAAPAPAFFRVREVLRITALTRPTLYRRIAAGRFPPPQHLGGRVCAWSRAALQSWIDDPENYRVARDETVVLHRPRGRPRKYATA